MRPHNLDLPSVRDDAEPCPGGAIWWTRHTPAGMEHVLELPEDEEGHALELLLVAVTGGRTGWLWRDAEGAVLARVEAVLV